MEQPHYAAHGWGLMIPARQVLDAAKTEKQHQAEVIEHAKLTGWLWYFVWRSIHSPAGFPDLTLIRPPRLIFAELKTETGKESRKQKECLAALREIEGIEVYVWRPRDWPEIEEILKR